MIQPCKFRRRLGAPLLIGLLTAGAHLVRQRLQVRASQPDLRSQDIILHANDAIISTDARQTILEANHAAAAMFGSSVAAMRGVPLEQFIPRDLRALGEQTMVGHTAGQFDDLGANLRMMGRRATDYAVSGLKTSGELFPLEGSISSMRENGAPIYTIILRDITARKQVQVQLEQSYSQLRQLSATLQTIREEERTHIARELHDDLGQLLATLRLDLTLLQQNTAEPASATILQGMDGLILTAIASLRRIASNLRPRALDEGGLYFALQSLRQEFIQRYPIEFELLADEADLALDDAYSTAIYRIMQEALTNITRHAQAKRVTVALHRIDSELSIAIQDDGRGIADGDMEKASSFGLLGMRERVWGLHGEIGVNVNDGGGTRIDIVLPLPPKTAAAA